MDVRGFSLGQLLSQEDTVSALIAVYVTGVGLAGVVSAVGNVSAPNHGSVVKYPSRPYLSYTLSESLTLCFCVCCSRLQSVNRITELFSLQVQQHLD